MNLLILPESFCRLRYLSKYHSKGIKTEDFSALLRVLDDIDCGGIAVPRDNLHLCRETANVLAVFIKTGHWYEGSNLKTGPVNTLSNYVDSNRNPLNKFN